MAKQKVMDKKKRIAPATVQRDIKKIDKTILDNFYKLVHSQSHVRLTAAVSTFKILTAMRKAKNLDAFNEHLNYCVERLVTGLSSSRAFARRGYGTLLLEVLKKYQVSCERLLTLAQQKFGNISNETTKDNLLGYFLLIRIVLQSGNYKTSKQNESYVEKMYRYLLQLKEQKSYFDLPVSKLLVEEYETFYPYMLADIPPGAFGSDAKLSHTELLIISLCHKKEPITQLKELDRDSLLNISRALLSDRLNKKPLHPVWIEFSKMVMFTFPNYFKDYCPAIIHPNFFKPNHNELAAMGLELILRLIEVADYGNVVDCLITNYVVRLLLVSLRTRNSLYKPCTEFFNSLNDYFRNNPGNLPPIHFNLMRGFIFFKFVSPPGSMTFDDDSRSQSIANLLNHAHPQVLTAYLKRLIQQFGKKFSKEESTKMYSSCARQIAHVVRRPQMAPFMPEVEVTAKFLIVNGLFSYVDPLLMPKDFWDRNDVMPALQPLDVTVKEALRSAYHATLDYIVSCSKAKERINTLHELIKFITEMVEAGAVGFLPETGDVTKQYMDFIKCSAEHFQMLKSENYTKILYPVTSLFLLYGLQIIEHGLQCREQLDDLNQVAKDAVMNDPSDGSWADVLTDQIIAILSATECNPWIRKLCVSIFGSLLPHISETSIDLICDAVKAPLSGPGEDDEDECSDMEDEEMSNQKENEDGEEEEGGEMEFTDGSDSSEDDSELSMIEEEPSGETSKPTNGTNDAEDDSDAEDKESDDENDEDSDADGNGDQDDDDDEEEEYLDDEQMLKLDSVIADMFKSRRVGKKKKRDPSFKLRCLDLVKKIIMKKHNDTEVITKILATIVPLAAKSNKSAETRPIADKINQMIKKMPGKSKLCVAGLPGLATDTV